MLGILDLLNSEDASEATMSQPPPPSESHESSMPGLEELSKSGSKSPSTSDSISTKSFRVSKLLPRSKVHPSLLKSRKLVDIALRHKSGSKRQAGGNFTPELGSSKLHLKLLEAGLRVRLILCPAIYELFRQLTPHTAGRNTIVHVAFDNEKQLLAGKDISPELKEDRLGRGRKQTSNGSLHGFRAAHGFASGYNGLYQNGSSDWGSDQRSDLMSSNGLGFSMADLNGNGSARNGNIDTSVPPDDLDGKNSESNGLDGGDSSSDSSSSGYDGYHDYSNPSDYSHLLGKHLVGPRKAILKRVRLIDNNLVNLAGVSSKVLKSFQVDKEHRAPSAPLSDGVESDDSRPGMVTTFNLLDTAVMSLFGTRTYSLVRVTRSSSNTSDGSVLLKLECAKPGDTRLVDDREFMEDMVASLGREGQTPNNLFIKKVVARSRYKSDMKIYIVPTDKKVLLYVDRRVFERDLINGVIEMDCPTDRYIYTTFPVDDIILDVRNMLNRSNDLSDPESSDLVPNHMTDTSLSTSNLHKWNIPMNDMELSVLSPSSSSLPSLMSNTNLSGSSGSVSLGSDPSLDSTPNASDRAKLTLLSIPNAKMELIEEPVDLKFDTSYVA